MIIDESIIALNGPGARPIFNSTPTLTFVFIGLVILKGGGGLLLMCLGKRRRRKLQTTSFELVLQLAI